MNRPVTRYPNSHRSAPMRESFVSRCKTPFHSSLPERSERDICFNKAHLSKVFVRLIGLIVRLNNRIKTQIPIGRYLF